MLGLFRLTREGSTSRGPQVGITPGRERLVVQCRTLELSSLSLPGPEPEPQPTSLITRPCKGADSKANFESLPAVGPRLTELERSFCRNSRSRCGVTSVSSTSVIPWQGILQNTDSDERKTLEVQGVESQRRPFFGTCYQDSKKNICCFSTSGSKAAATLATVSGIRERRSSASNCSALVCFSTLSSEV